MVQQWIDVDEEVDLVELINGNDPRLRRIALFDAIANNADRKVGHLLALPDGLIQGVDHGICFAVSPKMRTVLWGGAANRSNRPSCRSSRSSAPHWMAGWGSNLASC